MLSQVSLVVGALTCPTREMASGLCLIGWQYVMGWIDVPTIGDWMGLDGHITNHQPYLLEIVSICIPNSWVMFFGL